MLKAILSKTEFDGLDEATQGLYAELDDDSSQFLLQVQGVGGFFLENVNGLKTTLSKLKGEVREAKRIAEQYEGIDPEEARTLQEKVTQMQNWTPEEKVAAKIEAIKGQMETATKAQVAELQKSLDAKTRQLRNMVVRQNAVQHIAKVAPDAVEILLPHVEKHMSVIEDPKTGELSYEIVDADGNPRVGNANGDGMTLTQLLVEMKNSDTFGRIFPGDDKSGSGTPPRNGNVPPNNRMNSISDPTARLMAIRENQA